MTTIEKEVRDENGLIIVPLRRTSEEDVIPNQGSAVSGALLAFGVIILLWCYYCAFGYLWLALFEIMGLDLLWGYVGVFVSVAVSMGVGVGYSMKSRRLGWWAKNKNKNRDTRGQCCGFQLY